MASRDRHRYRFLIECQNLLSVEDYIHFLECLRKGFPTVREVSVEFHSVKEDLPLAKDYFYYFLNEYIKEHQLFSIFKNVPIELEEKTIIVTVESKAEQTKNARIHCGITE